jgi:hypothetical protein
MNVIKNYNLEIIKYSLLLNFSIILNYFFWFTNTPKFLIIVNFFFLIVLLIYFIFSPFLKKFLFLKILFVLNLLLILGSPSFSHDLRSLYLFSSKILFYTSNFFETLNSHHYDVQKWLDVVNTRPRIISSLSSSFALLIGFWNESFPKSTNLFFMLSPVLLLFSFIKNKNYQLLFFLFFLFFSGKILILGLNDGLLGLYFTATFILTFFIMENSNSKNINYFYFSLFLFASILSLIKNEGTIMLLTITISYLIFSIYKKKKINSYILLTLFSSYIPIIMWRITNYLNSTTIESFQSGNPFLRLFDNILILDNYKIFFYFLFTNDKLLISIIALCLSIFILKIKKNNMLSFLFLNLFLYFIPLTLSYFISSYGVLVELTTSSGRTFIPIILMISFYVVYSLDVRNFKFKKKYKSIL